MNAEPKISLQSTVMPDAPDRMRWVRRVLMGIVPVIALLIGGAIYLSGGRYVSTDNAYIKADIAAVSPEAAGNVLTVLVAENQKVTKDQPLLTIDDTNSRIALAGSEAQLRTAMSSIEGAKARYRQKQESLAMMQSNVAFAEREYKRQATLASSNYVAAAKLDEAKHMLETAQRNIALLKQEQSEILAGLEGDPNIAPEKHPAYQQALVARAAAMRMIERATVTAPFDGIVSQLPRVGDYARTGAPILSLVSTAGVWIDANFKETDLTQMKVGQAVEISVDTYPGRAFRGHVASIAQATGSEFAVLPAQNSTGNWIKVVQRVPVRISVDATANTPPLRAGMSATAEVDTGIRRFDKWFSAAAAE
jgi:membrane fusion protein (multidrug efflux system)